MSQKKYKCSFCGDTNIINFYPTKRSRCAECHNKDTTARNKSNKQFVIDYFGGSCNVCGYSKCNSALEVHHLDRGGKDPSFKNLTSWSKQRILKELLLCILLCANCHREEHEKDFGDVAE